MLLDHASEQFAELVRAIDENGGTGKILLEVSVKKASRGGAMLVTGKSTLKKPADEPMEAMLFATPEGNLIADDPRQQKLDLKRVESPSDTPPAMLKTV
ncbi:hypothetical protein QS306_14480 [Paraburkholderia bonniea]|uniref:hypothetical protein n=1 Tax=Paraburkholderia bonniea TaxID=2152891 RepID=UPI001FE2F8BF|nr:hypothetical protein [Paraburkholderia bonniea]WJF91975.1 hypothetical protein QS306_14480 [Paraburkholderia bonniea]WJF95294.1 hypothetical protein QS308_14485 [Paraburkholderia bonniea]